MAMVPVYSARYHDQEQDLHRLVKGKCTREKIAAEGWQIIESTVEDIDSSMLSEAGRYHPPKWARLNNFADAPDASTSGL